MPPTTSINDHIRQTIKFRANTSDDKWIIPEIVQVDMYRFPKLAELLKNNRGYILDCGAHIGAFTLMAVHFLPWLEVRSYEPQTDNFQLLVANTEAYPQVKRFNAAVSVEDGTVALFNPSGETGNWSCMGTPGGLVLQARAVRFADIISNDCQLVKLDLEGYEAQVLNQLPLEKLAIPRILVLEEHGYPIDYDRLHHVGLEILFRPYNSSRHSVWCRKNS